MEEPMNFQKITERIYYLPATEETDRPILGYIKGTKHSLMLDAGNSPAHVALYNAAREEMGFQTPDYVAITHWHWDHTYGMCAVEGKVIAHELTNQQLKIMASWKWTEEAMAERLQTGEEIEFCDNCIRLEYKDPGQIRVKTADITFNGAITIDLGDIHCELIHIGGPHSKDSVAVYIPEEKVLFIGDAEGPDYYHNDGKYDKNKLQKFMEDLQEIDFEIYMMGHGTPDTKENTIKYLEEEISKLS
jgi:glyoxylase-like metal-dependent hydrolase (beta-lactamase superfamily II)